MKINIGYTTAIKLGEEALRELVPEDVCSNTGVTWDGETYIIPWMGNNVRLTDGSIEEQIIWYHYLAAQGPKQPRNNYINYNHVPGAAMYNDNFVKRATNPMIKVLGKDFEGFLKRGEMLGGVKAPVGHMSFTINILPYIPITYVLWEGDDEFPVTGNILFDETAIEWMCAEDLVVLASLPVYKMLKMKI